MSTYWSWYFLAWVGGTMYFCMELRRRRMPLAIGWDAALLAAVLGVVVAHVAYPLFEPAQVPSWREFVFTGRGWASGYLSLGGLVGVTLGVLVASKLHRVPFVLLADLAAPTVFLASALGRIGCFFHGCCYGGPTTLPWGLSFPDPARVGGTTGPSHPLQLYEAGLSGLALLGAIIIRRSGRLDVGSGRFVTLCLAAYLTIRFGLGFLGSSVDSLHLAGLTLTQVVSLAGVAVGLGLLAGRRGCRRIA